LQPPPSGEHMAAIEHKQLWQAVADQLREEILDGRLPAGSRLVETELAERFGVSRGPIRDALAELARSGLAVDLPRRGTFVPSLTEQAAVRLAIEHADDSDLAAMYAALDETERAYASGDLAMAWEADMAFHRSYCRISGNGRLLALFDELASQTVLLMRTALVTHASLGWTPPVEFHRHIADGIRARDAGAASDAVGAHYQYTQDRLRASTGI
jgi:DNA-binding GntR family transcriptional regulator